MPLSLAEIARAVATPIETLRLLDKLDAEERLADFIKLTWSLIDPAPLVWSWPMDALCEHYEALHKGQIQNFLGMVPPGFSKSSVFNLFGPAWEWGPRNQPQLKFLSWSYHKSLTIRDNRRCRQLIETDLYQSLWGDRFSLAGDQNAKERYDTDKNGFRIASSIGGMGTGERGDVRTIDDPHSVKGAESEAQRNEALSFLTETYPSRVTNDKARSQVIGQRTNREDVGGHILDHYDDYEVLLIEMEYEGLDHPARRTVGWRPSSIGYEDPRTTKGELACPERFSAEWCEKKRKEMESWGGEYAWAAQYRQWPTARGGGMCKEDDIQICQPHEAPPPRARAWDFAASAGATSPYTASVLGSLRDGKLYIWDVTADHIEAEDLEAHFLSIVYKDGRDIEVDFPQDPGGAGKIHARSLASKLAGFVYRFSPESGDKIKRFMPVAAMIKAKNVLLVEAAWNRKAKTALGQFPMSKFKDIPDAMSRLLAGMTAHPEPGAYSGYSEAIVVK